MTATSPGLCQPVHCRQGGKEEQKFSTKKNHQQDNENVERQRENDIDNTHLQNIDLAAEESRDRSVKDTDGQSHCRRAKSDRHRNSAAIQNPHKQIAAECVRSEPMSCSW